MGQPDGATKASRESKHTTIFNAIDQLGETYYNLERLFTDAGGTPDPPTEAAVDQSLTLSVLLDSGADRINSLCNKINEKLAEFRQMIL